MHSSLITRSILHPSQGVSFSEGIYNTYLHIIVANCDIVPMTYLIISPVIHLFCAKFMLHTLMYVVVVRGINPGPRCYDSKLSAVIVDVARTKHVCFVLGTC